MDETRITTDGPADVLSSFEFREDNRHPRINAEERHLRSQTNSSLGRHVLQHWLPGAIT